LAHGMLNFRWNFFPEAFVPIGFPKSEGLGRRQGSATGWKHWPRDRPSQ
jgi:hypothetical protein